jgi:hypothetical protein
LNWYPSTAKIARWSVVFTVHSVIASISFGVPSQPLKKTMTRCE